MAQASHENYVIISPKYDWSRSMIYDTIWIFCVNECKLKKSKMPLPEIHNCDWKRKIVLNYCNLCDKQMFVDAI